MGELFSPFRSEFLIHSTYLFQMLDFCKNHRTSEVENRVWWSVIQPSVQTGVSYEVS